MIKINLALKDDNLKSVLKSKIELSLNNNYQEVYFVEQSYVKDTISNDILVLFFELENNNDIKRANELKELIQASCIILLSKDESLVFESLRMNPLQFIRLNNFDEDFKNMVEVLLKYIKNIDTVVTLKSGSTIIRLNVNNIMFIESLGHYLIIHSTTGEYQVREKLSNIIEQINNPDFIRSHKSYIINLNFIEKVLPERLTLKNNMEIPIGRNFKEEVVQGYNMLIK